VIDSSDPALPGFEAFDQSIGGNREFVHRNTNPVAS
jgi:hypothetical protein